MSIEQILEIVATVAFMVFSVLAQILNYLRTGKVSSKVDSILPVISSSDVSREVSEKVEPVSLEQVVSDVPAKHEFVDIDHDMDFVTMSRSMYDYFLQCEKQALSVLSEVKK